MSPLTAGSTTRRLLREAKRFPWATVADSENPKSRSFEAWNVGFVRAGQGLFDAMIVLLEARLPTEANVPFRALVEVTATQAYMAADPQVRAAQFEGEEVARRDALHKMATEEVQPLTRVAEWMASGRRVAAELKSFKEREPDTSLAEAAMYPFGKKPLDRIRESGLAPYVYRLYFAPASDVVHMNARAVATYLWRTPDQLNDLGAGLLVAGADLLLHVLYRADEVLHQGMGESLDAYGHEFARLAYPQVNVDDVLNYLRGAHKPE